MQHVDQQTLDAVLNHSLSDAHLARIKEHVRGCRMCARRLEEYRDLFSEVEVIIPTAERDVVAKPGATRSWREILTPRLDDAVPRSDRMLQIGMGVVTVLVLAVVVFLVRSPSQSGGPIVLPALPRPPAATTTPTAATPAPASPTPTKTATLAADPPAQVTPPQTSLPKSTTPKPVTTTRTAPASPRIKPPVVAPSQQAASPPSTRSDNSHTPLFRRVESTEAIVALGGSMRLIDGVAPDHFEMAPGTAVPGAAETLPVIRVIYRINGITIFLDQQRNPAVASRESMEGTAPEGVSVMQWSSGDFWLTLAGRVPADSLELLARRVR